MGRVWKTVLVALGLTLVWALPAAAAPTWSSSTSLSTAGVAVTAPSVAINDGGLAIEAWAEMSGGHSVIRAAQHAAGGAFVTLAGSLSSSLPGDACNPFTSIDPSGNALVVWTQWAGSGCFAGNQTLLFSTRAAGAASFTAPQPVGASALPGTASTIDAVNAAGQMVVTWSTTNASFIDIFASVGSPTTGFGSAPKLTEVTSPDQLYYLTAAMGPNGDAAVQWEHYSNSLGLGNIEASVRPRGGGFPATPTPLTMFMSVSSASNGSLAIDDAGDVISAYSDYNGTTSSFVSQLRPVSNGVWRPAQPIVTPAAPFTDAWIEIGVDAGGNATVVWLETNFTPTPHLHRLWSATRAAGLTSAWTTPSPLTEVLPGVYAPPHLRVVQSGAAAVSWEDAVTTNNPQALYRPSGGAFGPLTQIGAGSGEGVSLAPSGDAAFSYIGAENDARVSVLDVTPPTFAAANVPATATTGQAVAMSASAADAWSALASNQPSWNFGDGTTGAGASVSHAFAAPGTYTVTIGANDALGNAAAAVTRQIVVTTPVTPPPPPPVTPPTTVAKPKLKASYVASHLVGSITLSGTAGASTTLSIAIIKHGAKKASATSKFAVKAGKWTHKVKLPSSLKPARYDVVVSGKGVKRSQTSFTIAAPKSGIVARSYASGSQRGPAATTLTGTNELWAHFAFGTLPAKKQKITTQWTLPNGSKLGANTRPRASLIEAQIKDLAGKALPTGTWRCVVRAGGVVVATLSVRLK